MFHSVHSSFRILRSTKQSAGGNLHCHRCGHGLQLHCPPSQHQEHPAQHVRHFHRVQHHHEQRGCPGDAGLAAQHPRVSHHHPGHRSVSGLHPALCHHVQVVWVQWPGLQCGVQCEQHGQPCDHGCSHHHCCWCLSLPCQVTIKLKISRYCFFLSSSIIIFESIHLFFKTIEWLRLIRLIIGLCLYFLFAKNVACLFVIIFSSLLCCCNLFIWSTKPNIFFFDDEILFSLPVDRWLSTLRLRNIFFLFSSLALF